MIFSKITKTPIFITILAPRAKPLPLQNAHLGVRGLSWAPPGGGTLSLGTPLGRPRGGSFPPGTPLGPPKTDLGAPKASRNRPSGGKERPRATSNPQSEHAQNVGNTHIYPPGISKKRSRGGFRPSETPPETLQSERPYRQGRSWVPRRAPGSAQGPPKDPQGPSRDLPKDPQGRPKDPHGPSKDLPGPPRTPKDPPGPPQDPQGTPEDPPGPRLPPP